MGDTPHISVIIGTYNRCDLLGAAIERILAQQTGGLRFELIVVDNNSTDATRQAVESFIARGHRQVRYLFEGRQGVAHARNAGIAAARAPIVAFTDDDILVAPDWLAAIHRAFEQHPEADLVGGKVLPQWSTTPPGWLTIEHWSPLALLDYGDEPILLDSRRPSCLVTANLAVRRHVFGHVGLFNPELQRVKDGIGSTEDHELMLRFYRQGRKGVYAPDVVVTAAVQPERLTKSYHRRWHTGHGRFGALMGLRKIPADAPRLFGRILAYFAQAVGYASVTLMVFLDLLVAAHILGRPVIHEAYWAGLAIVPAVLLAYAIEAWAVHFHLGIYIRKDTRYFVFSNGVGAAVTVAGNLLLVPLLGLWGAALSACLCYLAIAVLVTRRSQRLFPIEMRPGTLLPILLWLALGWALGAAVQWQPERWPMAWRLAGLLLFWVLPLALGFFPRAEILRLFASRSRNGTITPEQGKDPS